MMIATVARSGSGCSMTTAGSNSMPTDTKNRTAKASRSGSVSSVARRLSGVSPRIMPAKNAPKAKETTKTTAAPKKSEERGVGEEGDRSGRKKWAREHKKKKK